jgi:hypothetical protein
MPRARIGKYDSVLPGLPKAPPKDPTYQMKVDQVKADIVGREPIALAEVYITLRRMKERVQADLSAINLRIAAYEQLLDESQESHADGWGKYGVKHNALRLPSGDTIRVQPEPYGQVKDKEAFRRWCIENGYEGQLQLWPTTMNAVVRERLVAGEPLPDGTEVFRDVTVFYVPKGAE